MSVSPLVEDSPSCSPHNKTQEYVRLQLELNLLPSMDTLSPQTQKVRLYVKDHIQHHRVKHPQRIEWIYKKS